MIEAEFHYATESLDSVIDAVLALPDTLRPKWFGRDESKKSLISVGEEKKLRSAISKAKSGFFLHADKVSYSFLIRQASDFEIYVPELDGAQARVLIDHLGRTKAVFAYAAERDERIHRNRLVKKASYGVDEVWVGRDWRRYVPGLYWLTLLSEALLQKHDVSIEALLPEAKAGATKSDQGGYILCFFENAREWSREARRLDDLCEKTPGFFAISRVKPSFEKAGSFLEVSEALHNWR